MKRFATFVQFIIIALFIALLARPVDVAAQSDELVAAGVRDVAIVGGQEAERGERGWQVMVNAGMNMCGGALIAGNWVVTAAHCLFDASGNPIAPEFTTALMGEHNVRRLEGSEQSIAVTGIFIHDGYNPWTSDHDIALLRLATPVVASDMVTTIPLVTKETMALAAVQQQATVTGWGVTSEGGTSPKVLMEATVPITDNAVCNASYGGITENMLCAGFEDGGVDACQGDSGGPLVVADELGNWHLAGIVSFGNGCAQARYYGVYTRVSQYVDWVNETVALNGTALEMIRVDVIDVDAEDVNVDASNDDAVTNVDQPGVVNGQTIFLPIVMN